MKASEEARNKKGNLMFSFWPYWRKRKNWDKYARHEIIHNVNVIHTYSLILKTIFDHTMEPGLMWLGLRTSVSLLTSIVEYNCIANCDINWKRFGAELAANTVLSAASYGEKSIGNYSERSELVKTSITVAKGIFKTLTSANTTMHHVNEAVCNVTCENKLKSGRVSTQVRNKL